MAFTHSPLTFVISSQTSSDRRCPPLDPRGAAPACWPPHHHGGSWLSCLASPSRERRALAAPAAAAAAAAASPAPTRRRQRWSQRLASSRGACLRQLVCDGRLQVPSARQVALDDSYHCHPHLPSATGSATTVSAVLKGAKCSAHDLAIGKSRRWAQRGGRAGGPPLSCPKQAASVGRCRCIAHALPGWIDCAPAPSKEEVQETWRLYLEQAEA